MTKGSARRTSCTNLRRFAAASSRPHLYDLALLVAHPHDDLHVLLRGLVVLVEVAALQREVDVVADVPRHDDLREAQLAGHHRAAVHQVRVLLPDLHDVAHQGLHGHPQTCKCKWTQCFNDASFKTSISKSLEMF